MVESSHPSSTRNVCAVTTRAQRRQELSEQSTNDLDNIVTGSQPVSVNLKNKNVQRAKCHKRKDAEIQRCLEPWSTKFLASKQSDNADLNSVRIWIEQNVKPS